MTTGGAAITWPMKDGVLQSGKGMIETKAQFTDFQLHVEFATPKEVKGDGQGRGNSGVFLLGQFEVQVLDSYNNPTYPDGQASAMYGQYPPLVNASRPPGEWQAYDIIFTAPRFNAAGNTRQAGRRHGHPQRHRRPQRHRVCSGRPPTRSSTRTCRRARKAHPPAGSREPRALQEHLDQADQGVRRNLVRDRGSGIRKSLGRTHSRVFLIPDP